MSAICAATYCNPGDLEVMPIARTSSVPTSRDNVRGIASAHGVEKRRDSNAHGDFRADGDIDSRGGEAYLRALRVSV